MFHQKFEKDIILFSVFTRLVFLLISVVSRLTLPGHNPVAFTSPLAFFSSDLTICDSIVFTMFSGLANWDAQHFYHIAQNGYIYEQSWAFFPMYPYTLSMLSNVLSIFIGEDTLNDYSKLMLVSFLFNSFCFCCSAVVLFRLSRTVLKNNLLALQSSLLFCISPASVFFLASYSETIFSLFVFSGMLKYASGKMFQSALYFSLASACRSNGIMNVGFILHYFTYAFLTDFETEQLFSLNIVRKIFKFISKVSSFASLVIAPYILFQLFGYYTFCSNKSYFPISLKLTNFGLDNGFTLVGDPIIWCNDTFPFPYSYVQAHYWNVGFLKYYTVKQVPNFILALPIIIIITFYSINFLTKNFKLFFHLKYIYNHNLKINTTPVSNSCSLMARSTFVFVVHSFVLMIFCILNINIQVTTRIMCSSSPLLYWISVVHFKKIYRSSKIHFKNCISAFTKNLDPVDVKGWFIRSYFLIYSLFGIILFSCKYPWT